MSWLLNPYKTEYSNKFSFILNGADEYLNTNNLLNNKLKTTTKGTWSTWIKPVDATPLSNEDIISFGDVSGVSRIEIINLPTGKIRVFCRLTTTKFVFNTDNVVLTSGVYTHIAIVQNAIAVVLYIDKILVDITFTNNNNVGAWFSGSALLDNGRIGNINFNQAGEASFFNGNIDETSFWNDSLTLDEISEIYNGGTPNNLLTHSKVANLVGWYRMGEDAIYIGGVWTMPDASGNNNDSTSMNMEESDRESIVP